MDDTQHIIEYYLGKTGDHLGRTLGTTLNQSDRWLEDTHDYIQWLFPLFVASRFNPQAPILSDSARSQFLDPDHRNQAQLQANLALSVSRMICFYGYQRSATDLNNIIPAPNWEERTPYWLTPDNHNHLRITRILRSTTLLGQNYIARQLLQQLETAATRLPGAVSRQSLELWQEAVILPA
jgi:hypothetical protein